MEILQKLKQTSKGQLKYRRKIESQDIKQVVDDASRPYRLKHSHLERPTHVQGNKLYEEKENVLNDEPEKQDEEKSEQNETPTSEENHTTLNSLSLASSCKKSPVSPEYGRSISLIKECEQMWDNKARAAVQFKQDQFKEYSRRLQNISERSLQEQEEKHQDRVKQHYEQTNNLHKKEMAETIKRVNKLKELHNTLSKKLEDKLQEGQRKKQEIAEEVRKRQEEMQYRQMSIQKVYAELKIITDQFDREYSECAYKQYFGDVVSNCVDLVKQLKEQADSIINKPSPSEELCDKISNILDRVKNAFDLLKQQIENANDKGKSNEEAKKQQLQQQQQQQQQQQAEQEAQKKAASQPTPTTTESVVSATDPVAGQAAPQSPEARQKQVVMEEIVTEFVQGHMHLKEIDKTLAGFLANQQMKKYKFSLQKAVNVPINAISPVDGSHLRMQIQKLLHLLGGNQVEMSGKHVTAKDVPEGLLFCKNLIAKMIVKKGEEQVTSNHESAFSIAMVAAGLWQEHEDLGKMLLHHFHSLCPYLIPYYFPRQEGMTLETYHKFLGYKIDGSIEAQDKFLKRMSGIMRLYASILISSPPKSNQPHPHGIEYAWIWLSRILNMDPQADITATMTYDMLQVTGHALFQSYKMQFVKLVYLLHKDFLPRMKKIAATGGPVVRLENFLETLLKNLKNGIAPRQPDGYLPPNYWFT